MRCFFACLLVVVAVLPGFGQKITKVGEFTSYENDVEFLPGAVVILHNDIWDARTKTKVYKYKSGKFVRSKDRVPPLLSGWSSLNWEAVDDFNQLDLRFVLNPSISSFLPPYSKVKGYASIKGLAPGKTLAILCYTAVPDRVPEADRTTEGGAKDLHLLLTSRPSGQEFTDTVYTKLADVLVAKDVAFGAMLVERQPTGTFVAVYFADGGSHQTDSVAIFRVYPQSKYSIRKKPAEAHKQMPLHSFGFSKDLTDRPGTTSRARTNRSGS